MAPMVFGVPKVIPGVFFMALGLGGYWLFGLSRLRGWTLIAIVILTLTFFLYGVRLVWAWLADRKETVKELLPGEVLTGRPWLRVHAWRRREIVFGSPVGTGVLLLAYLFFGAPALLFLWAGFTDSPTQSGASLRIAGLLLGSLLGFILVALTYWRLRHWRYGNSVCRLITLPGRLGGWLKADVDCALPGGADDTVTVRLKNMEPRGRSVAELWRMEQRMAVPVQGERTVVAVRLQIPRAMGQRVLSPNASAMDRFAAPWWVLEVEKKVPGIDFLAQFGVPVYDVPEMPETPAPQLQAQQASGSDRAGRWMAALITVAGAAALVAITYQASRIGWLSTSIMAPSADWMTRERYQRELDVWSMSHYPPAIEGRCAGGREAFRSDWQPIPPHTRFMTWYSLTRRDYERKSIEYAASGYTLESTTQYTDCAGVAKFQATWLKR
jgi:hypothetical protein